MLIKLGNIFYDYKSLFLINANQQYLIKKLHENKYFSYVQCQTSLIRCNSVKIKEYIII